jgi:excisionase family DNA binding protein
MTTKIQQNGNRTNVSRRTANAAKIAKSSGTQSVAPELPEASVRYSDRKFEPLLDDRQASSLLGGIHPKTLQRLARTGQIPAYRVGRFWRYRASELDSWLQCRLNSGSQPARVDFIKENT